MSTRWQPHPLDRYVDVRLAPGSVLRLTLRHDEHGRRLWGGLSRGHGDGPAWSPSLNDTFTVGADCLTDLRAALAVLGREP